MQLAGQIRRYASAGWRHRWKALAVAWAVCLAGWAVVVWLPSQYQASARIYADADVVLSQLLRGIAVDQTPAGQVDLLQRTLLSQPNLQRVIARTDLDLRVHRAADRENLLKSLARDIKITSQTRNLFTITYSDRNPQLARDVVRTLLDLFMEAATSTDRQQMENARAFVAQQVAAYEVQLREAERRRAEFRARHVDLLPSDAAGTPRSEAVRGRLIQLRGELQDARLRQNLLRQQLEQTPPTVATGWGGGAGGGAPSTVAEAERALRELRLRYTEQHPDVATARRMLADLRASGGGARSQAGGPASMPNPVFEQLKLRAVDLDAQIASLERQIGEQEAEMARLDASTRSAIQVQADSLNLDRDYAVLLKNYEELLGRREAVQISGAARTGADRLRLEVVDPPTVPTVPTGPNRMLLAAGVLVVGLGAGAALALLLVQLDTAFYTLHDLRRLGLPVMGGVSSGGPARRPAVAATAFAGGLALLLLAFGGMAVGGDRLSARLPGLLAGLTL